MLQENVSCYRQHSHKLKRVRVCNRRVQRPGFSVSIAEVWLSVCKSNNAVSAHCVSSAAHYQIDDDDDACLNDVDGAVIQ